MHGRLMIACLLLFGVLSHRASAELPSSAPPLVQRTYPVADLICGHDNYYLVPPGSSNLLGVAERRPAARETTENELIKLVVNVIAPNSWQLHGGTATIDYFPLGMALVIEQTPEVHARIAELLDGLRAMQQLEVVVETRLLSLSDAVFEQVCSQLCILPEETDLDSTPPDGATPNTTRTLPEDIQIFQVMELVQGDRRSTVLQAPKLTVFDGQTASLEVVDYQYFVTNVQIVEHAGSVVFVPQNQPVPVGMQMQVKPVVSVDRRSVQLDLKLHCTDVAATVPLLPVETFITPLVEDGTKGEPVSLTQFVQRPKVRQLKLDESVQLPDQQTVALAGWRRSRQLPSELGSLLADLLGPNFDGLWHRDETEHLLLLVTPRIIVSEEAPFFSTGLNFQQ